MPGHAGEDGAEGIVQPVGAHGAAGELDEVIFSVFDLEEAGIDEIDEKASGEEVGDEPAGDGGGAISGRGGCGRGAFAEKDPEEEDGVGGGERVHDAFPGVHAEELGGTEGEPPAPAAAAEGDESEPDGQDEEEEHHGVTAGFGGVADMPRVHGEHEGGGEAGAGTALGAEHEGEEGEGADACDEWGEPGDGFVEGFGGEVVPGAPSGEGGALAEAEEVVVAAGAVIEGGVFPGDGFVDEGALGVRRIDGDVFAVDVGCDGPAFVAPVGEAHFGPADDASGDAEGEKKDPEKAGRV